MVRRFGHRGGIERHRATRQITPRMGDGIECYGSDAPNGAERERATTMRTATIAGGVAAAGVVAVLLAPHADARPNAKCEAAQRNGVTAIADLPMCQRDVTFSDDGGSESNPTPPPDTIRLHDPQRRIDGPRTGYQDDWVIVQRADR